MRVARMVAATSAVPSFHFCPADDAICIRAAQPVASSAHITLSAYALARRVLF